MKLASKKLVALIAGSLALLGSVGANAATATATFQVTATVVSSCLVTATTLAFGSIAPNEAGTPKDVASNIAVTCSNTLPYTVTVGFGANAGSLTNRFMKNGANADKLAYNIYKEVGRTTVLGTAAGDGVALVGSGVVQNLPVYGRLLTNQFVSAGTYTDTLTVNVAY